MPQTSKLVFPLLCLTLHCGNQLYKFLNDTPAGHRTKLVIANSGIATNLVNFPLMVKLDATRVNYAEFKASGADIRFYDSDAVTALSFEIERWDTAGTSVIWVKVPQIDANSSADYIWMYYGDGSTSTQSNTSVWDANFRGVWHFASSTTASDSTQNGFDGTTLAIGAVDAQVGKGYSLNGSTSWVNLGGNKLILGGNSFSTVSAWVNFTSNVTSAQTLLSFSINTTTANSRIRLGAVGTNQVETGGRLPDGGSLYLQTTTSSPLSPGTWQYVTAVYDYAGQNTDAYINGVLLADDNAALSWAGSSLDSTTSLGCALGVIADGVTNPMNGKMDEVRVSNSARSAAWILADYKSTSDTYLTFIKDY